MFGAVVESNWVPEGTILLMVLRSKGIPVRDVEYEKRIELDAAYVANWSLRCDCKLLFQTIPVVLCGFGAR
jgi:lipopolysaccharide/colanic/teichoic acid biosynthesis glycosyltransferase